MKQSIFTNTFYFTAKFWAYSLLFVFGILTGISPLHAEEVLTENPTEDDIEIEMDPEGEYYIGFFIGSATADNEHTDVKGFANWGYPGSRVEYSKEKPVLGAVWGKRIDGTPVRFEIDGAFGKISASTNQLDPKGLDETAKTDVLWLVTARVGFEKEIGPVTLLVSGGPAFAQIRRSVIDMDYRPDGSQQVDPDDSFEDDSIELGLAFTLGAEFPLTKKSNNKDVWTLRAEFLHADFGKDTHAVNHSGNNSCGPGGPRSRCDYIFETEIGLFRLVFEKPFTLR